MSARARAAAAASMFVAACAIVVGASGAPPDGYKCGGGKPVAGKGCACPAGKTEARDKENDAICIDTPASATTAAPSAKPPPAATTATTTTTTTATTTTATTATSAPKPPPYKPPVYSSTPASPPFAAQAIDARPSMRPAMRAKPLVLEELTALHQLLGTLDVGSNEHAITERRIAEDDEVLESLQGDVAAQLAGKPTKQAAYDKERAAYVGYRDAAIAAYRSIIDRDVDSALSDQVLYALADEHDALRVFDPASAVELKERAFQEELARTAYFDLIKAHPSSPYAPWAYVAFADVYFADAAAGRVGWDLARDGYTKALSWGTPSSNGAYGYAADRLGFVEWHLGDAKLARAAFNRAVEWTGKHLSAKAADRIGKEAASALSVL